MNGLVHANELLGEQVFKLEDWKVIGEYVYDDQGGRHQAFYSPVRDVCIRDITVRAGERIQIEESLKYSSDDAEQLWKGSGLREVDRWSASSDAYSQYLLLSYLLFLSPRSHLHYRHHGWHRLSTLPFVPYQWTWNADLMINFPGWGVGCGGPLGPWIWE